MREILFRGKPIDEETIIGNDFYYGDLCHYANGEVTIRQPETGYEIAVLPETVGQFTGITDVNGVKVFEGDIITVNSKIVKQVRINDTFLAVQVANKEDLKFIDLLDPWQTPGEVWWNDFGREIIVIGNIHDNHELLNNQ